MDSSPLLEMTSVSRRFGSGSSAVDAVRNVSLSVRRGEVVGVLGPNGAGKTTTVKIASTLIEPSEGAVLVAGVDAVKQPRSARRHIGLVLGGDRGFYMRATARENLDFFAELQGVSSRRSLRSDEVLEMVGLQGRARSRVETFSRGMKQRLHIARALLADPALVLLDEPSIGLDPESAHDLRSLVHELRAEGRGILLTTHYLEEADELSDRLVVIADGRLVAQGSTSHIARLGGVPIITTITVGGSTDPRSAIERIHHVESVEVTRLNGLWLADVTWSGARPRHDELRKALGSQQVTSLIDRPASLEEAYLAFIHHYRRGQDRQPR